jgi:hypothetical protein
MRGDKFDLN